MAKQQRKPKLGDAQKQFDETQKAIDDALKGSEIKTEMEQSVPFRFNKIGDSFIGIYERKVEIKPENGKPFEVVQMRSATDGNLYSMSGYQILSFEFTENAVYRIRYVGDIPTGHPNDLKSLKIEQVLGKGADAIRRIIDTKRNTFHHMDGDDVPF